MRTTKIATTALVVASTLVLGSRAAMAQAKSAKPSKSAATETSIVSRWSLVPSLPALSAAGEAAEEQRYATRAAAMRGRILAAARWAPLGDDSCGAGALRTFADETTPDARAKADSVKQVIEELEYLVIQRGVGRPLATPSARALLSTVAAWEAGGRHPDWDVAAGQPARSTIAAGLTGRVRNPVTKVCGPIVALDTARVVLPVGGVTIPPGAPQPVLLFAEGDSTFARARARTLATPARGDTIATFPYVRVRSAFVWSDYAVVSVARAADRVPGAPPAATAGNATYLFHRVGDAWRLLVITRSWM